MVTVGAAVDQTGSNATEIALVWPFQNFRIITPVTQKGKGKVSPSQRLWWEESMTSSIVLPPGTWGQSLTGINSSPLISRPVVCVVVSQPLVLLLWEPLVIVSEIIKYTFPPLPVFVRLSVVCCTSQCLCTLVSINRLRLRLCCGHDGARCLGLCCCWIVVL